MRPQTIHRFSPGNDTIWHQFHLRLTGPRCCTRTEPLGGVGHRLEGGVPISCRRMVKIWGPSKHSISMCTPEIQDSLQQPYNSTAIAAVVFSSGYELIWKSKKLPIRQHCPNKNRLRAAVISNEHLRSKKHIPHMPSLHIFFPIPC